MRKLILSMMMSVDGFFEGPNHELNWPVSVDENGKEDPQLEEYFFRLFDSVDYFLFGRKAYEILAPYWLAQKGKMGDRMNAFPKLVFSRTLEKASWNARIIKENAVEEIRQLKSQNGKDLVLFAGADLASFCINHGLVDEYRLIVSPVVMGKGRPLFKDVPQWLKLKLIKVETFDSLNVILFYKA